MQICDTAESTIDAASTVSASRDGLYCNLRSQQHAALSDGIHLMGLALVCEDSKPVYSIPRRCHEIEIIGYTIKVAGVC